LSTVTWINPAGGDWDTASNWDTHALPGPADDVVINGLNTGALVTHSQNVTDTIHGLTAAAPITLAHGKLDLSGGSSTAGALSDSSPFSLAGGTLRLADVQAGTVLTVSSTTGGTLDRLTLGGTLSVSNAVIDLTGGLTLAGGVVQVGNASQSGQLSFDGDQTVGGTGQVQLAGRGGSFRIAGAVVLGPGITVHGTSGSFLMVSGSLVNQGAIDADGGGTVGFDGLAGTSWSNAPGGALRADGGTLDLGGAWSNAGLIAVNNSTLDLGGRFTTAGLGALARAGGTIDLTGTLDNTGTTLVLDAATGSWNFAGGTLKGGILATLDGTTLVCASSTGTLDGVTLGGTVDSQARPGAVVVANANLSVTDGLTLANGSVIQVGDASQSGQLDFNGDQTVGGTGQIQFAGGGGNFRIAGAVLLGPGITVHETSGLFLIVSGGLVNQGTIDVDGSGLSIDGNSGTWSNAAGGTLRVEGSTLTLGDTWSNSGQIVASNSTLNLGGSWSSSGTISQVNSTVNLGGTFKTSGMGTLSSTGGVVNLTGTLTNDGTLALTADTGPFYIRGGTIVGGRVTTSGNAALVLADPSCTLNAVMLAGTIDGTLLVAHHATVLNGLTLDGGTVKLLGDNSLAFVGSQTLGGTGTVSITAKTGGTGKAGLRVANAGDTLTVAPGVTISGDGFVGSTTGGSLTNRGAIVSDDGGTMTIQGATNFANGTLTGGTWQASGNSTLRILGAQITTNAASVLLGGAQSHLYSDASATDALASLSANAAGGQLTLIGGASLVDTAGMTNGGTLTLGPNSSLTAASYTQAGGSTNLQGGTVTTSQAAGVAIQAGTFSGPGSIKGNVTNAGSLDLGTAPGSLSVTGNYTQAATGTLGVKLGGTAPGSQYDQVHVTGSATLGGTLDISLVNGFGPSAGQAFQVLSYAGSGGSFAAINGLEQDNQATLKPVINPTDFTLQAIATAPNLVATGVTVPPGAVVPGQPITVGFTVKNLGGTSLGGSWVDSVFLSGSPTLDANSLLIGKVPHAGGLAVNASYAGSLTAPLPGVPDGTYYVLVEADSQKLVGDSDRGDNTLASPPLDVAVPALSLDAPVAGTVADGQDLYYRVTVPPGEDVRLEAQFAAPAEAEFLVSRFQVPTRSQFDQVYPDVADLTQDLVLPASQPGSYFIHLHGREGAGGGRSFTLRAAAAPFAVQGFDVLAGPGKGRTTLALTGAGFTPRTTVRLLDVNSHTFDPVSVTFVDSDHIDAAFDLGQVPRGSYDVQAVDGAAVATAPAPFANRPPALVALVSPTLTTPEYIPVGGSVGVTLDITNYGQDDELVPILQFQGTNVIMQPNPMTVYPFGGGGDELLPSLAPGASTQVTFAAYVNPAGAGVTSSIGWGSVDLEKPIDWAGQEATTRPSFIAVDAWHAIYANLTQAMGPTPADNQQVLFDDSLYLSQLGEAVTSTSQLHQFELMKADDEIPAPSLSTALDASFPAPGLPLTFERTYVQSIMGRYHRGTLGRGWVSNWDISVSADGDGVIIDEGGAMRAFTRLPDGTYQAARGDSGTLTLTDGTYRLREQDGTTTVFLPSGQWNYVADPDGNRITAGYTGGLLTSLTHSDGDRLTLAYNAQGLISQVTDPGGRVTTYTYDAGGQHLLGVTTPAGTTQYTYVDGPNIEQEHALQSVTYQDGTHDYFGYDALGRLTQESGDDGAGLLEFTYFSPGGYSVTDANGATTTVLYDVDGKPARVKDPLGNVSQLKFDSNGRLTSAGVVGLPGASFTHDDRGNVNRVVDPLGSTSRLAYNPTFGSLQEFIDPKGDQTRYQQDDRGNALGVTYADGSTTRLTPDARGETAQIVKASGRAVANTYNARGQVVGEAFSDGTHTDFTYDSHGNLATATSAAGTTALQYDGADRPVKVTYPGGQFLEYTYDGGGRRSSMTDQTGFTVNYQYDAAGRLAGMTDGNGGLVVRYTYNAVGQLVREDMGNGTYTTHAYDAAGDLTSLVNHAPDGSINSRFDYTYDAQGRRTSMTTLDGTTTYGYDAAGELTSAKLPGGRTITFAYDTMGNRTVVSDSGAKTQYATNELNQYTSVGGYPDAYDADGNLTLATGPGGNTVYTYDAQDRLIGVRTATDTWAYQYDALGNRIAATHNGQTVRYLVDPLGLGDVVGEFDGGGNLVAHYTQGLGLTSRVDASNAAAYYDFDANGNTAGLSGQWGLYLDSYKYLPFGQLLSSSGSLANPFRFGGQVGVTDEGNGLDFMRARFYSPTDGRFIGRDPIGLAGGNNLYAYVGNNPVDHIDPSGLADSIEPDTIPRILEDAELTYEEIAANYLDALSANSIGAPPMTDALRAEALLADLEDAGASAETLAAAADALGLGGGGAAAGGTAVGGAAAGGAAVGGTMAAAMAVYWIGSAVVVTAIGSIAYAEAIGHIPPCPDLGPLDFLNGNVIACDNVPIEYAADIQHTVNSTQVSPIDPNFISGPAGYGPQGFVPADATLPYVIGFENEPDATAPAQVVTVTQQLDPGLDWSTFQLGDFGFGGRPYAVPTGRQFYSTRIDARASVGVFVDMTASLDRQTGVVTWTFTSIDPTTMDQPTGDPLEGFLPPDLTAPEGVGWVEYSVKPSATDPSGTAINAQAAVVFNTNDPIATQPFVNTLDVGAPSSRVAPLPARSSSRFTVSWSGDDDPGGSGVGSYDVYVSDDGGPFTLWQSATTKTSAIFSGLDRHTYAFYSVATDNVGHVEPTPPGPEATTYVNATAVDTQTSVRASENPSRYGDPLTFTATVTPASGDGAAAGTVQFLADGDPIGPPVAVVSGSATSPVVSDLAVGTHVITAAFSDPTQSFNPSTGTLSGGQAVTFADTTTGIGSSLMNCVYGQSITFTATVLPVTSGLPAPTGEVQFLIDGASFGAPVTLVGGQATSGPIATLGAGAHAVRVDYLGDGDFATSSGSLAQDIAKAPLMLVADSRSMSHYDPVPALTYHYAGFVLADDAADSGITAAVGLSTPASSTSPAGRYPILPTVGGFSAPNYTLAGTQDGTMTVEPRVMDVRVDWGSQSMSILGLDRDLPFDNITAIDVIFSDDVNATIDALSLAGALAGGKAYSFSGFSYNPATADATFTLPTALGVDRLMLALNDGVTARSDPAIPLAPFTPKGVAVLPGDVNGDGAVNASDMVLEALATRQSYVPMADLDGDGFVDLDDVQLVRRRIGMILT
jgi:RHS repeat-associated protein